MDVKNGCKDLKKYPQISRRVRDTLARLYYKYFKSYRMEARVVMEPFAEWAAGGPGGSPIAPRRPRPVPHTRLPYGPAPQQFCDLRLPPANALAAAAAAGWPVAVFVHGGAHKSLHGRRPRQLIRS